jgi:hypothetical protein
MVGRQRKVFARYAAPNYSESVKVKYLMLSGTERGLDTSNGASPFSSNAVKQA